MGYTYNIDTIGTAFRFIQESVFEFQNVGIRDDEIYVQVPCNFMDALWQYNRVIYNDPRYFASWEKDTQYIFGAKLHPIGYESKVVVYYKKVLYRNKDLIRIMDLP